MLSKSEQSAVFAVLTGNINPHETRIEHDNRMARQRAIVEKLKTIFESVEMLTGVIPEPAPVGHGIHPANPDEERPDIWHGTHTVGSRLFRIAENQLGGDIQRDQMNESFADLHVDDLDRIEIVLACEDEFEMEIPDNQVDLFKSFVDMHNYIKDSYRGY